MTLIFNFFYVNFIILLFYSIYFYNNYSLKKNEKIKNKIINFNIYKTFKKKKNNKTINFYIYSSLNNLNKNIYKINIKNNVVLTKFHTTVPNLKSFVLYFFNNYINNNTKYLIKKSKIKINNNIENEKSKEITIEIQNKINFLKDNIDKNYLTIECIDKNNETSDVQLNIEIKGNLREYYYDLCVKEYKEKKLKQNKYEFSYLNEIPLNSLINYINPKDYFNIFLKYINNDIIKIYKKWKNLSLIGSPRLLNNINHIRISKYDNIFLNFSIDKYPIIKFNESYINLNLKVKIPPYKKGTAFNEFLKAIENENEIVIPVDKNHKIDWNDEANINVLRGWVYSTTNNYYNEFCYYNENNKNENNENDNEENDDLMKKNEIEKLIDIDNEENYTYNKDVNKKDDYDTYFNKKNKDSYKSEQDLLKHLDFTNYFKEGYRLPDEIVTINNSNILIKEKYNPLGFSESLIGMMRNDKKNITVYLPVYLFKEYFKKDNSNNKFDMKKTILNIKNNKIDQKSINEFKEIIYNEIKKFKGNTILKELEKFLKENENKFYNHKELEKLEKEKEKKTYINKNNKIQLENDNTDIDSILNDDNIIFKEYNEKEENGYITNDNDFDIENDNNNNNNNIEKDNNKNNIENDNDIEREKFDKHFNKFLEDILKDDIKILDKNLNGNNKINDILNNVEDLKELAKYDINNDEDKKNDDDFNDYIFGQSDLIECILEVEILDIKRRKKNKENLNNFIFKKYNKSLDEIYNEIENRAIKDIKNKCIQQKRIEAYNKLMDITSLNIPLTLFHIQGKIQYKKYLKDLELKKNADNINTQNILTYEEYLKKSKKKIYDQIKFSFIIKSIFNHSKLKINYDNVIKDVLKTLIKTPTNDVKQLIQKTYTMHQAQTVLDFVSINSSISYDVDNTPINFSVTLNKNSNYDDLEHLKNDDNANQRNDENQQNLIQNDKELNLTENKIYHSKNEPNYVVENKIETDEQIKLNYYTFKKGANYKKYFDDINKKKGN